MTPKAHKKSDYEYLIVQETLILDATELIVELLKRHSMSRQELARKLGRSKGFVTQLLSGERNMTLRTLADLGHALGHRFELRTVRDTGAELTGITFHGNNVECFNCKGRPATRAVGDGLCEQCFADFRAWRDRPKGASSDAGKLDGVTALERWMVDYEHGEGEPQHAVLSWLDDEAKGLPEVGETLVRLSDVERLLSGKHHE